MEKLIILLKLKIGEKCITQSVVSYTKDTKGGISWTMGHRRQCLGMSGPGQRAQVFGVSGDGEF